MDSIYLQNVRVPTRIGITAAERAKPQDLFVSVWLSVSIANVAASDNLAHGIDYALVTEAIIKVGQKERKTLESFTEDLASILLQQFQPKSVTVCTEKHPDLPIEAARITITRP